MSKFINAVKEGRKYRLRANTKLGNKIKQHIDTLYQSQIKQNKKSIMDYF